MRKICSIPLVPCIDLVIIEDLEREVVYVINEDLDTVKCFSEQKNMIYEVWNYVLYAVSYSQIAQMLEEDKLEDIYRDVLVEMMQDRMSYKEYMEYFKDVNIKKG